VFESKVMTMVYLSENRLERVFYKGWVARLKMDGNSHCPKFASIHFRGVPRADPDINSECEF